jgi:alkyl hydroperoxide reductase subunit AhpC
MLTANDHFPAFSRNSVVSLEENQESQTLTRDSHPGKWPVVFSLLDFTFVCAAEIAEVGQGGAQ